MGCRGHFDPQAEFSGWNTGLYMCMHHWIKANNGPWSGVFNDIYQSIFVCKNIQKFNCIELQTMHTLDNSFYKITKIVCALWLAKRSVCMRVCKHGCGVKLFGFSHANHASTNLKKFSSSKLDKFTLFTHSFVGWNMENRYKEGESIFLRLSWHFKREKSVFCKAFFCKTRTDYVCKTSWTRFCAW